MRDKFLFRFIVLAVVFVTLGGAFIVLNLYRNMSNVETALFQILTWGIGLTASYVFARGSARESALEVVRPHARSAFRRVLALYNSLYRLSAKIEELKRKEPDYRLELVQALVHEQIATGQDAMEDWRDLVPEEVKEVERRNRGRR